MRFSVTFEDVFENCESEEEAYDALLGYLADVVQHRDVTAFDFQRIEEDEEDDGQPDEAQEWESFDADC